MFAAAPFQVHTTMSAQHPTSHHPTGITVEIVGTEASTQGRSCDRHLCCGSVLSEDVVVRLRKVQVVMKGKEEPALAAYLISDGIDQCRVGFLPRHLIKHSQFYDGAIAQVTEVYSNTSTSPSSRRKFHHNKGCCIAALISDHAPPDKSTSREAKRQKTSNNNSNKDEESYDTE